MKLYKKREEVSNKLKKELNEYSPLLQSLLYWRGVETKEDAQIFLNPDWKTGIGDPFLIHDMKKAVERILEAVSKKEKIVIYGDYDCDGIPGSVVLHDFFKKIEYLNFSNYIPHRHDEGYGVNKEAIEKFAEDDVSLIITVDVGITDIESIGHATDLGIDVIVTDHHMPIIEEGKDVLPDAYAILNSKKQVCTYDDDMLCGAGVAFKLVQALLLRGKEDGLFKDVVEGWEKWLLDMVGMSTIADMVPLKKENRVLASFGLKVLRKSKRVGLLSLLKSAGVNQSSIEEGDVGFMLAPRVNAASRMDHPLRAFELLSTDDVKDAEELAQFLNKINDKRKGYVASMIKDARKRLEGRKLQEVIVIGHKDWQLGVLGLAANKIAEEYSRPTFVWGFDSKGNIKGSCRSGGNGSVLDIMRGVPKDGLVGFGGHDASGGFAVSQDKVHTLEDELSKSLKKLPEGKEQETFIDATLHLDDVNWSVYNDIVRLAPFGMGNAKPLFKFENVTIDSSREFGKTGGHLGLTFKNSTGGKIDSIGFFMAKESFPYHDLNQKGVITLIAEMEKSEFRGRRELRLRIVDIV